MSIANILYYQYITKSFKHIFAKAPMIYKILITDKKQLEFIMKKETINKNENVSNNNNETSEYR